MPGRFGKLRYHTSQLPDSCDHDFLRFAEGPKDISSLWTQAVVQQSVGLLAHYRGLQDSAVKFC